MIKLNWLFFAFALIVAACSPMGTEEPTASLDESASAASINVNDTCGGSTSYGLFAGNTQTNVGEVKVSNDDTNLYVEIFAASGTTFNESHLNISCAVPTERGAPGQYNSNGSLDASSNSTYRKYAVALSALPSCGDPNCLNLLVHVATGAGETAFGGTSNNFNAAGGGSWFNFVNYCVKTCYVASGVVTKQNCDDDAIAYGGVTVNFKQGDNEKSTTTDADGSYSFTKIGEGDYTISVAGAVPSSTTVSGNTSDNNFVVHFYSISGTVYVEDCDGNTTTAEAGVAVSLSNGASATTEADGSYTFTYLANGNYSVSVAGAESQSVTVDGTCDGGADLTVKAVKCACSLSQGYWFAKPDLTWETTVTLGGKSYTQAEGKAIWNSSNKGGLLNAKAAFTQASAIKLSNVAQVPASAAVWADVAIIDAYFASIPKISATSIPKNSAANAAAGAAAGRIGQWISENHCE